MNKNVCSMETIHCCTGCGMCAAVCPFGAIVIIENENGFYRPVIDEAKCKDCSLCSKVCYKFDDAFAVQETEDHECYSAVNKDTTELQTSSSGGVSIELMRECIRQGYYVAGVAYDTATERAITKIARTAEELEQFKGSKYFQSDTADAFSEIERDQTEQKYAIFGTPCQIYAFSKMADCKGNREKYIFVDIFCHGCPSLKLWDKYLTYSKKKYGIDSFNHINFRSKTHGWHEYCFDFEKDGKTISSTKYNDPFYEMFFSMDAINDACYDCIARSTVEKTDIRIGDFWGCRHDMDTKGVSAVVISTEKGKQLFEAILDKFYIEQADFQEIIVAQSYQKERRSNSKRRNRVLFWLTSDSDLPTIVKKYRKMLPVGINLKRMVKSILKHLPEPIYLKLKTKLR